MTNRWMTAVLGLLFLGSSLQGQDKFLPSDPIMPVSPKVLLPALPAAPENWKITLSEAANQYAGWQTTVASRDYLEVITPAELAAIKPGEKPRQPGVTKIKITDTGFWPASNGTFKDFAPGKSGNLEKEMLEGYPMVRVVKDGPDGTRSDSQLIILWVKQRFLVAIEAIRQPKDAELGWAKRVAYNVLATIPADGEKKLPNPLTMITVDELNPKNNGSGRFVWTPVPPAQPSN